MISKTWKILTPKSKPGPIVSSLDNEVERAEPETPREDERALETRSQAEDISMETSDKTKFAINNSVVGLVKNINGLNVSSYCDFIESNFPINEEDWKDLKEKILEAASTSKNQINVKWVSNPTPEKKKHKVMSS